MGWGSTCWIIRGTDGKLPIRSPHDIEAVWREDEGDHGADWVFMMSMLIFRLRHLAIASSMGHVATFDWQAGKLHSEIQLRETVRDIK